MYELPAETEFGVLLKNVPTALMEVKTAVMAAM